MNTPICYSPRPAASYAVMWAGAPWGFGVNPFLAGNPAAWNLFWLSYPPVDELLTWPAARAGDVPSMSPLVDACVLATTQCAGPQMLGEMLRTVPAARFVAHLEASGYRHLSPYALLKDAWVPTMRKRAEPVPDSHKLSSVVQGNFARTTEVTARKVSASIHALTPRES